MKIKIEIEVELEGFDCKNQDERNFFSDHILVADGFLALHSTKRGTLGRVSKVHKIGFEVKD